MTNWHIQSDICHSDKLTGDKLTNVADNQKLIVVKVTDEKVTHFKVTDVTVVTVLDFN